MTKRTFDLVVCILGAPIWIPLLTLCGLVLLVTNGWPVLYVSTRRVFRSESSRLAKFRVMIKGADRVVNRNTVPCNGESFLNIPWHSSVYTRVGQFVERCSLTELPQIIHVLQGRMSVVGNRPLPENVIDALRESFPDVEQRFRSRSGLAGPVQLVGRDRVDDAQRLKIEIAYCRLCEENYSAWFDTFVIASTILICMGLRERLSVDAVMEMMRRRIGSLEPVVDIVSRRLGEAQAGPLGEEASYSLRENSAGR